MVSAMRLLNPSLGNTLIGAFIKIRHEHSQDLGFIGCLLIVDLPFQSFKCAHNAPGGEAQVDVEFIERAVARAHLVEAHLIKARCAIPTRCA